MQAEDRAAEERIRPDRVAARNRNFQALQGKINAGAAAGQLEVRVAPAINEFVERHTKWLMRKLYDSRERNGDIVFVFKPAKEAVEGDIEIPVPSHAAADIQPVNPAAVVGEEEKEIARIRCHRQVLLSQSDYFKGLVEFNI